MAGPEFRPAITWPHGLGGLTPPPYTTALHPRSLCLPNCKVRLAGSLLGAAPGAVTFHRCPRGCCWLTASDLSPSCSQVSPEPLRAFEQRVSPF